MTCTEMERLLDQKETDAQTLAAMQRHAEQCAHCRMLMELRALDNAEEVPEEVSTRWRAALRTEQAKQRGQAKSGFLRFRALAPLAAAAAVLVAAVALRGTVTDPQNINALATRAPKAVIGEKATPAPEPLAESAEVEALSTVQPQQQSTALATFMPFAQSTAQQNNILPAGEIAPLSDSISRPPLAEEAAVPEAEPVDEDFWDESVPEEPDAEDIIDGDYDIPAYAEALGDEANEEDGAEGADSISLSLTAADPQETAGQLLAQAGGNGTVVPDDECVRVYLTVTPEEWPALQEVLIRAGYAGEPALDGISFGASDSIQLTLIIEKEE